MKAVIWCEGCGLWRHEIEVEKGYEEKFEAELKSKEPLKCPMCSAPLLVVRK